MFFINIATEDELSEAIGVKIVSECIPEFSVHLKLRKSGFGYLKKKLSVFCEIAKREPVLLITDLDQSRCPSALIASWMVDVKPPQDFIFRVAIREIESWLLADQRAIRKIIGAQASTLPRNLDDIDNPKDLLLRLVERGAARDVKRDLLIKRGEVAAQGLGYNDRLCKHIEAEWNPERAAQRSDSLERMLRRLKELRTRLVKET